MRWTFKFPTDALVGVSIIIQTTSLPQRDLPSRSVSYDIVTLTTDYLLLILTKPLAPPVRGCSLWSAKIPGSNVLLVSADSTQPSCPQKFIFWIFLLEFSLLKIMAPLFILVHYRCKGMCVSILMFCLRRFSHILHATFFFRFYCSCCLGEPLLLHFTCLPSAFSGQRVEDRPACCWRLDSWFLGSCRFAAGSLALPPVAMSLQGFFF